MKVLVTGGAGYIGAHAVLGLLSRGDEVVVFDSLALGYEKAVKRMSKKYPGKLSFLKGDLKNKEDVSRLFSEHKDIEAVIHFAAYSLVGESMKNPGKYYENNVGGSLNLFEGMVKAGVKKIVFSSTAATYGEPEVELIKEDTPTEPINPYGNSKLTVEKILEDFYKAYGLNSIRLRYFNVAGDSETGLIGEAHDPETHLIPLVLQAAAGVREKIIIFGDDYNTPDGTCIRDYIHVEDLIDAHLLALDYLEKNKTTEYINLGTQGGSSVKEIVELCKKVTGVDFKVEIGERRAGDPDRLVADSSKAKKILGWKPKRSLEDIISSAWSWHKNNPKGYST